MEKFFEYTDFILAIGVLLLWGTLVALFFIMWIGSRVAKNRFFMSVEKSLKLTTSDVANSIMNDFEVYRNHRFGFRSQTVIELCQELGQKFKIQGNVEYTKMLEDAISIFKDEYRFDDEKMNNVIKNIRKKSGKKDARETREYLIRLIAFHNGRLYEKDRNIKDIQEKVARRKWFNIFCGLLGVIGSLASIYSIFK